MGDAPLEPMAVVKILITLFAIVDPFGCIPLFLGMTVDDDERDRRRMAGRACLVSFVALTLFAVFGRERETAAAAAFAVAWAFAASFAAGAHGPPLGLGAALGLSALTVAFARALARRGLFHGDTTVATIVVVIASLLLLFIFYPYGKI